MAARATTLRKAAPAGDQIIGGEGGNDNDVVDMSRLSGAVTVTYTGDEAGTIRTRYTTIKFCQIEHQILMQGNNSVNATATH